MQECAEKDFILVKKLADGAFGSVFSGMFRSTPVSIKKIVLKRSKFQKLWLQQEISVHSNMRHPNIVQLILSYCCSEVFIKSNKTLCLNCVTCKALFLIQELVNEWDLDELILAYFIYFSFFC